uniref:Protein-tyrosine phosphatase n=1 Tax=Panagrellus redivivus TaxID=6233 RepID=A0A7E4ZXD9_PANRE
MKRKRAAAAAGTSRVSANERTKRQSSKSKSKAATNEDDGTQIETPVNKKNSTARKTMSKQGRPTSSGGSACGAVNKEDAYNAALRAFALATGELGVPQLCREFAEMRARDMANIPPKTAFDANPEKNRYRDVYCIDESRISLTWPPGNPNEYVHANYVPIRGEKRFICTQGPTEKTGDDFWRLVWQEKAKAIVMLCNVIEQGKPKCLQYWPETVGEKFTLPCGLVVTTIDSNEVEKQLVLTKLELAVGKDTYVCMHYLWKNWPDRGVPENFMGCFRLLTKIKPYSPVVVHCSAGIGRTGTVIGIEAAQAHLMAGEKPVIADIVTELRKHRHGSVQTDIQYAYIHRVLIGFAENRKLIKREEVAQFFVDYDTLLKARGCL